MQSKFRFLRMQLKCDSLQLELWFYSENKHFDLTAEVLLWETREPTGVMVVMSCWWETSDHSGPDTTLQFKAIMFLIINYKAWSSALIWLSSLSSAANNTVGTSCCCFHIHLYVTRPSLCTTSPECWGRSGDWAHTNLFFLLLFSRISCVLFPLHSS